MSRLLVIAILICSLPSFGQRLDGPLYLKGAESRFTVGVTGYGSVVSKGLNNRFLSAIMLSDQLDSNQILKQSNALSDDELLRVGGDYFYELQASFKIAASAHSVLFSIGDMGHVDGQLSKSVFNLAMRGNGPLRGDTLELGNSELLYMRFQKVGIGWSFQPTTGTRYSILASYVNGESIGNFELERASVYTSRLGDTLAVDAKGLGFLSDTANVGFAKRNGSGMAFDFAFQQSFTSLNREWIALAMIRDLGMVQWHGKTEAYPVDTGIVFTGIGIGQIDGLETTLDQNAIEDSLVNSLTKDFSRGSINQVLPGWFQLSVQQQGDKGFMFGGGITARWLANYRSYGWLNAGYAFNEHWRLDSEWGYGGYGSFQAGLSAAYTSNAVHAFMRVNNIEALIAQDHFGGGTVSLGIQYRFGG